MDYFPVCSVVYARVYAIDVSTVCLCLPVRVLGRSSWIMYVCVCVWGGTRWSGDCGYGGCSFSKWFVDKMPTRARTAPAIIDSLSLSSSSSRQHNTHNHNTHTHLHPTTAATFAHDRRQTAGRRAQQASLSIGLQVLPAANAGAAGRLTSIVKHSTIHAHTHADCA